MARRTRRRQSQDTPKIADYRDRFLQSLFRDDESSSPEIDAGPLRRPEWTPRLDVMRADEGFRLHIDLPGVRPEDLRLRVANDDLLIEGARHPTAATETTNRFLLAERTCGSFFRVLRLLSAVEQDGIRASFEDGVLTVRLPIAAERRPMHVSIE